MSKLFVDEIAPKTTNITISSPAIITPENPSFLVSGTDGNWRTVDTASKWYALSGSAGAVSHSGTFTMGVGWTSSTAHGQASHNIGNHFDTTKGHFTAPVTGGYQFRINAYLNRTNANNVGIYMNPSINYDTEDGGGSGIQSDYYFERTTAGSANNAYIPFERNVYYRLSVGDRFKFRIMVEAAGFQFYGSYWKFSGYLVG
jgi:hypothetical protein